MDPQECEKAFQMIAAAGKAKPRRQPRAPYIMPRRGTTPVAGAQAPPAAPLDWPR